MEVVRCDLRHLDQVAGLFDEYRQFYEQPSHIEAGRHFLEHNLLHDKALLFMVQLETGEVVGFAQLYPSYCSITLKKYHYLSDLYVRPSARRHGCARFLMRYLIDHFEAQQIGRLTLETATSNHAAQSLYESLGYEREQVFLTYHYLYR
ncbi:ribosomal protein S18 acetylase RimI-like enzyme [Chitinivorax tropicus]|uniref:Ribosomal protein S18 acetylase RimI-like enzyme n=1 Tax=Chitinivorax tropicus TaxID=714531 RepID=A0A840MQY4_9PROT|nr:GNAT family N-acetyltransferase [Chitinivorax tropicus]MBB5019507.1 ribosomal protein S18 acetylase RimI-like enzyme [Chitinivorax tropicus]